MLQLCNTKHFHRNFLEKHGEEERGGGNCVQIQYIQNMHDILRTLASTLRESVERFVSVESEQSIDLNESNKQIK